MEAGFMKADSSNLPAVNAFMVHTFYCKNLNFMSAEIKNVKTERSSKDSYGDDAIGNVQLKRADGLCIVKALITPEHRIHQKGYGVTIIINERDEEVISCECHDCAASAGGCKHGVAVLMWLHRRSEEPSVTSVDCYWKAPKLAKVGKSLKNITVQEMFTKPIPKLRKNEGRFLEAVVEKGKAAGSSSILLNYFNEDSPIMKTSIHHLSLKYKAENAVYSADGLINYCKDIIQEEDCVSVEALTKQQSKSNEWYETRYGRITASKVYEVCRCKTEDGCLVESILGSGKIPQTAAMSRGLKLEEEVLDMVQKIYKINIRKCGIFILKDYPIFGASPDGISEKYCIEIKCPQAQNYVKYIDNEGKISKKGYAQLQLQMLFSQRKHGLFCVASPSFEETKAVTIVEIPFDEEYCKDLMQIAQEFWKTAIYTKIIK
ncbi:uncharacterized protein [Onthophagus taurus]|uniref:uncharacterized protein n=1 Tax=Onthophagus taurus TaxID=166361 RepID=UPI000C20F75B|nr:uncharacterized protein LOC111413615 [Onthophagus taurus]